MKQEKLFEGTDATSIWYSWDGAPRVLQDFIVESMKERTWTAALNPYPLILVQSADRQVKQDVCRGWRMHLDAVYDHMHVFAFEDRSVVVWFNQMPPELVGVG